MKIQIFVLFSFLSMSVSCDDIGRSILKNYNKKYETDGQVLGSKPLFIGVDAKRKQVTISLQEVVKVKEPTDIQFPPGTVLFYLPLKRREI